MYDVVLISPHYHYDKDGKPLPYPEDAHYQDLSMVIPLGLIHLAQALHDKGLTVQMVHLPHEFHNLRRFGIDEAPDERRALRHVDGQPLERRMHAKPGLAAEQQMQMGDGMISMATGF